MRVAALFVEAHGVYFGLPDVDPWDAARDARQYAGPHPVVAHPPCERWGRYWTGGPSAKERRRLGDDAGCFASALASVQAWGGGCWSTQRDRTPSARAGFRCRAGARGGRPRDSCRVTCAASRRATTDIALGSSPGSTRWASRFPNWTGRSPRRARGWTRGFIRQQSAARAPVGPLSSSTAALAFGPKRISGPQKRSGTCCWPWRGANCRKLRHVTAGR